MEKIKLSFQDRFLLAFEREDLPFNSHFYFESEIPFDLEKVKKTFLTQLKLEPQLHITCSYQTGECIFMEFPEEKLKDAFIEINSEIEEYDYLERHFNFKHGPAVRLACMVRNHKYFLIFSFYHPLFDGGAQMNFLKDYFDIYQGLPYVPRKLGDIVTFKSYLLSSPIKWYFNTLFAFIGLRKEHKGKVWVSRLADHEPVSRRVGYRLLEFDRKAVDLSIRKSKLSATSFFSACAVRAFDKIQKERGDHDSPIVVFIPKVLRSELKSPRAFQNLIGFIWMKFSREKINQENFTQYFRDFYKFRSSSGEIKKVLLVAALITRFTSFQKLKKILKKKEMSVHDSSILISSGRTPKEIALPEVFRQSKFYARGAMHRSPGISILATSNEEKDFIGIEFLLEAFEMKTIERFSELLSFEISHYKFDP